jgi:hypothetical protein
VPTSDPGRALTAEEREAKRQQEGAEWALAVLMVVAMVLGMVLSRLMLS